MPGKSPFADDWRECLRAHYQYVVQANDRRTLETLTRVLHQVGFGEDELNDLYLRATLHVDDAPPDFTPDMTVVAALVTAAAEPPAPEALIAVAEAAARAEENPPDAGIDAPYSPEEGEPFADAAAVGEGDRSEEPPHDPHGPQQLQLF